MSSAFPKRLALSLIALSLHSPAHADSRTLRVCADPGNLPFSNDRGRGFENQIAELVARELHAKLSYTWRAQRRGFLRNTLNAGLCDVVIGVPLGLDAVRTTEPYYRSTFAFVARRELGDLRSLDDERLRTLRIAVPLAGDDGANPAPVMALSRRGITQNLVGFSLWDEYARATPRPIEAVARGEVDVAIVWGPVAGTAYDLRKAHLTVTPLREERDGPLPLAFSIAMGVRRDDAQLANELERVIEHRRAQITDILRAHHVPLLPMRKESARED